MNVVRCPSCGARYQAGRLPPGATFDCNRCGADVIVAMMAPASPPLLIGGLLVLMALFLWSADTLAGGLVWPWEEVREAATLTARAGVLLWGALGLWATFTAFWTGFGGRSVFTLALGALALVLATSSAGGGFPIQEDRALPFMVSVIALGAGLALSLRGHRGLAGRGLLIGGGLVLIATYTFAFGPGHGSQLERVFRELSGALGGTLPENEASVVYVVTEIGAPLALLLAAAGSILVGLGLHVRPLSLLLALLLVFGMVAGLATRTGQIFQDAFAWDRFARDAASVVGTTLVRDGVALWALIAWAVADRVTARENVA